MSAYRSDSMIADEVAQALGDVVKGRRILVAVHDGRVTLRGVVADPSMRRLIKDLVGDIDGVDAITDLITVDPRAMESPAIAPPPSKESSLAEARRSRMRN